MLPSIFPTSVLRSFLATSMIKLLMHCMKVVLTVEKPADSKSPSLVVLAAVSIVSSVAVSLLARTLASILLMGLAGLC